MKNEISTELLGQIRNAYEDHRETLTLTQKVRYLGAMEGFLVGLLEIPFEGVLPYGYIEKPYYFCGLIKTNKTISVRETYEQLILRYTDAVLKRDKGTE
jgi:hypothetical protein